MDAPGTLLTLTNRTSHASTAALRHHAAWVLADTGLQVAVDVHDWTGRPAGWAYLDRDEVRWVKIGLPGRGFPLACGPYLPGDARFPTFTLADVAEAFVTTLAHELCHHAQMIRRGDDRYEPHADELEAELAAQATLARWRDGAGP